MTRSDNLRPVSKRAEKSLKAIERATRREKPEGPDGPERGPQIGDAVIIERRAV